MTLESCYLINNFPQKHVLSNFKSDSHNWFASSVVLPTDNIECSNHLWSPSIVSKSAVSCKVEKMSLEKAALYVIAWSVVGSVDCIPCIVAVRKAFTRFSNFSTVQGSRVMDI